VLKVLFKVYVKAIV